MMMMMMGRNKREPECAPAFPHGYLLAGVNLTISKGFSELLLFTMMIVTARNVSTFTTMCNWEILFTY